MELRELQYLQRLQKLTLRAEWQSPIHTRTMERYLSMIRAISSLECLDLRANTSLHLEHLPPLSGMPSLLSLKLEGTSAWHQLETLSAALRTSGAQPPRPEKQVLYLLQAWQNAKDILIKDEDYVQSMLSACEMLHYESKTWTISANPAPLATRVVSDSGEYLS
eukprot:scaffold681725_cov57-Prasinocladus_malaysianus.AAC.1